MDTTTASTALTSITLETADVAAAERFYAAIGIADRVSMRASDEPSAGFRGFTISLIVAQPANVELIVESAIDAGAAVIKPVAKSLWGVGGTLRAPDGAIVKVATSKKKNAAPATHSVEDIVVLLAAADVPASKRFYLERGFVSGKSFGSYVEFQTPPGSIKLALYTRAALAKDAGVAATGSGSHRIVLAGGGAFTDPDGFRWV